MSRKLEEKARYVAVYARVSTQLQGAQGISLETQVSKLNQAAAMRHEGREIQTYQDIDSGRRAGRAQFKRLWREIEARNVLCVYAWSIDRLWRNLREGLRWIHDLETAGTSLVVYGSSIDTATPTGKAFTAIMMAFAELESDLIGARVREAHQANQVRGIKGPGLRPYGWRAGKDRRLEPVPEEQETIEFIRAEREAGRTWADCARILNRLSRRTVSGRAWSPQGLSSCLQSALDRLERQKPEKEREKSSAGEI